MFSDSLYCVTGEYACEKRSDTKGDHGFIWWQSVEPYLLWEIYAESMWFCMWCGVFPTRGGEDTREVFGDVVGHRVAAADNGSGWCSFLVDLGETIDAWNGLSRLEAVIGKAVNDMVLFIVSVGSLIFFL